VAPLNPPEVEAHDECFFGRFGLDPLPAWVQEPVSMERVLAADPAQLRQWFGGRMVLVGQMLPQADEYALGHGRSIFGCQVQALVLQDLLSGTQFYRLGRLELALLVGLPSLVAAVLANLIPIRLTWSLRVHGLGVGLVLCLAVAAALVITPLLEQAWSIRMAAAGCGLLGAGAVVVLVKLLHRRQLRLAPGPIWSADSTTASTTVLASPGARST
jgi:CHASE2 domain-containing sensor protein